MSNSPRWQAVTHRVVGILMLGAASFGPLRYSQAADPAFVGTLALAVEDEVAERLGISDETRAKLLELVDRRENEALEMVLSIKDLPPSVQTERLLPFVSESERMGLALLTVAQREKLRQVRIAREGMTALEEPGLAEALGLSDEQKATVKNLLEQRATDLTKGGEKERRITRVVYERKLAGVLDDQQRSTWLRMAGYSDALPAKPAPVQPDNATTAADTSEDAAEDDSTTAMTETEPAAGSEATESEATESVVQTDTTAEGDEAEEDEGEKDAVEAVATEEATREEEEAESAPAEEPAEQVDDELMQTTPVDASETEETAVAESDESGETAEEAAVTEQPPAVAESESPEETLGEAQADAPSAMTDAESSDTEATESEAVESDTEETEGPETAPAESEPAETEAVEATESETAEMPAQEPGASDAEPGESEDEDSPVARPEETGGERDQAVVEPKDSSVEPADEGSLQFNFDAAPWKDVLDWFAEQANLSLAIETLPLGSFTYRDDRTYTVDEALDLMNSYLLTKGFTLVRRQRILLVIDLEDDNPIPPELVTLVTTDELDDRGNYELVKCLFPLAKMKAEEAAEMIQGFLGPQGAVVPFSQARQVLVVETAGKLRAIRDMIARVENPSVAGPERVSVIELKYVTADEVLAVARPLLGLTEDTNSNEEISLSVDLLGSRIFATGDVEKLDLLRELVPVLDRAPPEPDPDAEEPEKLGLKTFMIKSADPQVVLRVVQTIMANMPGIRMEVDETSGKLVVLARPSEHATIQATIDELEGQAVEFEVIPLKRTDPQLAVMAVNKFFGLTGDEEDTANKEGPIVDGDPVSMQLWVRGTTVQIDQIKDLIQKLEGPEGETSTGPTVRMIPMTGPEAQSALDTSLQFWIRKNKIRMVTPSNLTPSKIQLRTITPLDSEDNTDEGEDVEAPQRPFFPPRTPEPAAEPRDDASAGQSGGRSFFQFVSAPAPAEPAAQAEEDAPSRGDVAAEDSASSEEPAEIRIAITPGGILIASEDTAALDALEEMLRAVGGPVAAQEPRETTVFYLKYAKAEVADQLIQEILNGRAEDMGGSLLGDMASDLLGGGLLGALAGGLGGGGEETEGSIQASGVITIVPDPRLNALIVEANPTDLKTIENLLKVIDREDSITDVLTAGTPRLIPVIYSSADEVANVIKQVFANKIEAAQSGGQRNQPSPEDMMRALRGQRSSREASQARGEEQKMTIGVDARSNAIIVTGPQKLFEQVEAMVKLIDQPGSEDSDVITVVPVRVSDPEVMQKALESILKSTAGSSSSGSSSSQASSSGGGGGPSPEDIRRRIEMFRSMQGGPGGGMFGGGRSGGSPFGGRGGPPGGSSRGSSRGGRGGR